MKKFIFIAAVLFCCLSFKMADAQISFHLGVNINHQPDWGPVGYQHARYYYMPDIDVYYDVNAHQYVYDENNVWVHDGALPPRFSNFDRYRSYKVVVNERSPWEHNDEIRTRYEGYRGRSDQRVIRDSRDYHYHNHWKEKGDNGQGNNGGGDHGGGDHGDKH
jgi:hypothetical protein